MLSVREMWESASYLFAAAVLVPGAAITLGTLYVVTGRGKDKKSKRKLRKQEAAQFWTPKSTLPVLGNTLDVLRNGDRFEHWIMDLCREAGDCGKPLRLLVPGQPPIVVVTTPAAIEDVQKTQEGNFSKGPQMHDVLSDLMGENLFIVEGERWKRQRRVLVNLFSARILRGPMTDVVQKHVRAVQTLLREAAVAHKPVDFFHLMHTFTLDAFGELGFGLDFALLTSKESETKHRAFQRAFDEAQRVTARRASTPTWMWHTMRALNLGSEARLKKAMKVVNGFVMEVITKSIEHRQTQEQIEEQSQSSSEDKSSDTKHKDVVSLLLDKITDPNEVRDVVLAALVAGHDTTADALSWFFHEVSLHPEVVGKIREEISRSLPEFKTSDANFMPSWEDLQQLVYLEATVREVLRLNPSVTFSFRRCEVDTVLSDGTFLPAGVDIGLPYMAMGHLKNVWGPDAEDFRPERFLEMGDDGELKLKTVSPAKFCAFGCGSRLCVGRNLAMMEMKMVVSCVLSRFNLTELPDQDITYVSGITLPMKNPLLIEVHEQTKSTTTTAASA